MLIQNVLGKTTFSKEVISKIVNKTLSITEGISSRSSYMGSLTRKLTGNSTYSGIELREQNTGIDIHLSVTVQYGIRVHEVCRELQNIVKEVVENFAGLTIGAIHVKVEGIVLG